MVSFFRPVFRVFSRRRITTVLAFFWCAGLVLGAVLAASADISRFFTMRTAITSRVSIFGLAVSLLLPLLLSALAVYISQIWLLIPIAFVKAFLFSYWNTVLGILFPSSGWLLRVLYLFADCLSVPALIWLWFRLIRHTSRTPIRCFAPVFILFLMIGSLDHRLISPFLTNLLLH